MTALIDRIKAAWDDHGECKSCGWHALLYEYGLSDDELCSEVKDGVLNLPCLSQDDPDGRHRHRGVIIELPPEIVL